MGANATKPGKKGGKTEGTKKKGVRKAVNLSGNDAVYISVKNIKLCIVESEYPVGVSCVFF